MSLSNTLLCCSFVLLSLCLVGLPPATAEDVDVYFVVGQSNAINFAKEAGTGTTDVGFTLHFARTADIFNDFPNHTGIAVQFSSNLLNTTRATSVLASGLQQGNRDVAIFSFARNGAGLHLNTGPDSNPWMWYPGADPATGDVFNDSLYANSISWNQARMDGLIANGHNPIVKGVFWFQGEKDGRLGDHDVYGENLDNLIVRLRQDYGQDLPVVVTQIREVTDTAANREVINDTLALAAANDPLVEYIVTEDLQFRSTTDVHLTGAGHAALAPRWSAAMLDLQAVSVDFAISDGIEQRSMLTDAEVSFSKTVTLESGAFELIKRGTGGGVVDVTTSVDNSGDGSNVVLTFSGQFAESSGSLVDGNYQLTIDGDHILSQGTPADIDGDGNPGGVLVFGDEESEAFYRFFGDADQNRIVNVVDLLGFRETYLLVTGDALFDSVFDSDLNGIVNVLDLFRLRGNFLQTLPFDETESSKSRSLNSGSDSGLKSDMKR